MLALLKYVSSRPLTFVFTWTRTVILGIEVDILLDKLKLRAAGSITVKVRDRQSHLDNPPGTTYVHNSKMINERLGEMF